MICGERGPVRTSVWSAQVLNTKSNHERRQIALDFFWRESLDQNTASRIPIRTDSAYTRTFSRLNTLKVDISQQYASQVVLPSNAAKSGQICVFFVVGCKYQLIFFLLIGQIWFATSYIKGLL
jgi:hypothetical protein